MSHFVSKWGINSHNVGLLPRARGNVFVGMATNGVSSDSRGNSELGAILDECRKIGAANDALIVAFRRVALNALRMRHADLSRSDMDDVLQNALFRAWRNWKSIDRLRNPKSYIEYIVKTEAFRVRRKYFKRKKFIDYDSEISDAIDRNARLDGACKLKVGAVCAVCRGR